MFSDRFWGSRSFVSYSNLNINLDHFLLNIRPTDEEAFMIFLACGILFHIAERIDFLDLCDFMGLSLVMSFYWGTGKLWEVCFYKILDHLYMCLSKRLDSEKENFRICPAAPHYAGDQTDWMNE